MTQLTALRFSISRYKIIYLLIFSSIFMSASSANAQIQFSQNNVTSAAQAQSFEYRLYITPSGSSVANPSIIIPAITCSGFAAGTANCVAVTPAAASAALITGAKSELTAKDSPTGTESAKSIPFFQGSSAPSSLIIK